MTLAFVNAGNAGLCVQCVYLGLAQSKNRCGLSWFLLSLPLGPLATAAITVSNPLPWPAHSAPVVKVVIEGGKIKESN